jgi:hypothetical protein
MIVGGFSSIAMTVRPAAAAEPARVAPEPREGGHFRQISTISPGSLAAAYQAIRAQEAGIAPPVASAASAILSGLGIPAALAAYGETAGEA